MTGLKGLKFAIVLFVFASSILFSYMLKIAPMKSDYIGVWNTLSSNNGLPYVDFKFEYPLLLGLTVKILSIFSDNYESFLNLNTILALISGLGATTLLYKIIQKEQKDSMPMFPIFWIFAPTMLMYGVYNWDLYSIFFILIAICYLNRHRLTLSSTFLAVGTCIKLLPIIFLPICILKAKSLTEKMRIITVFGATFLILNLPFMAMNFEGWLYPYVWQLTSRPPNPDSLWGFLIKELGGGYIDFYQARNLELANTINAMLYVTLSLSYLVILYFKRKENFMRLGFYCFTIFLLIYQGFSKKGLGSTFSSTSDFTGDLC